MTPEQADSIIKVLDNINGSIWLIIWCKIFFKLFGTSYYDIIKAIKNKTNEVKP